MGSENFFRRVPPPPKINPGHASGCKMIQCVFFYADKSICSFDPLKIASDWSINFQIICLVRTLEPRISEEILLRPLL